jgi:hypothetical protein
MTNRRQFLQTITAASLIFPKNLFSRELNKFFFIQTDTLNSWSVADPVAWSLENADQPILQRASERLGKLTSNDGERIIRLVVRRCSLNLLELHPGQVVAHHWGLHRADLRPFFKTQGLARPEIDVVLRERKKEVVTTQHGDDFLYGNPLASDFDLELFQSKWVRQFINEQDDWFAAPGTRSGYAWEGVEDGFIPWAAMKSAWRSAPGVCLNCDQPTMLVNFGLRPTGLFNRSPSFTTVCGSCRRWFRDETVKDVGAWIVANLDEEVRPGFEMRWEKRVKWEMA